MTPAELNQKLGAVIREKRVLLGLSQEVLGQRIGVTFQQIQKYEKGKNQVTFPRLVELAGALGTTAAELVAAALGEESAIGDGLSDRETLELVKRIAGLKPNQRLGLRLLVQNWAEAV